MNKPMTAVSMLKIMHTPNGTWGTEKREKILVMWQRTNNFIRKIGDNNIIDFYFSPQRINSKYDTTPKHSNSVKQGLFSWRFYKLVGN